MLVRWLVASTRKFCNVSFCCVACGAAAQRESAFDLSPSCSLPCLVIGALGRSRFFSICVVQYVRRLVPSSRAVVRRFIVAGPLRACSFACPGRELGEGNCSAALALLAASHRLCLDSNVCYLFRMVKIPLVVIVLRVSCASWWCAPLTIIALLCV